MHKSRYNVIAIADLGHLLLGGLLFIGGLLLSNF
jgi:hypothetical protein